MNVELLVTTANTSVFQKIIEMPFAPIPKTVIHIMIGGTEHCLVATRLDWDDERQIAIAWLDGKKMTESRFPIKDQPNFYFEHDKTWRRNH